MSTRSTRSKQKAAEVENATPARSTRSGGRSGSPSVLTVSPAGLRSASPARGGKLQRGRGRGTTTISPPPASITLRSASPAGLHSSIPVSRGKAARGRGRGATTTSPPPASITLRSASPAGLHSSPPVSRGKAARGRGRGATTTSPPSARGVRSTRQSVVEPVAKRGRGRGRGRSTKSPSNSINLQQDHTSDNDGQFKDTVADQVTNSDASGFTGVNDEVTGEKETAETVNDDTTVAVSTTVDDYVTVADSKTDNDDALVAVSKTVDDDVTAADSKTVDGDVTAADSKTVDDDLTAADSKIGNDETTVPASEYDVVTEAIIDSEVSNSNNIATETGNLPATGASALAIIERHLSAPNAAWDEDVDLDFKHLESVLSSEEGLQLLSEQPETVEVINEMTSGDQVVQNNSLKVSPKADPGENTQLIETETLESTTCIGFDAKKSGHELEQTAPRRKSERVTDLERRALAEKIRQENIRKEQEMLDKLKSDKEKLAVKTGEQADSKAVAATHSKAVAPTHSKAVGRPKKLKNLTPVKSTDSKPVKESEDKGKKSALQPETDSGKKAHVTSPVSNQKAKSEKSSTKKSKSQPKTDDIETDAKSTPDASGWIPGKIKVIDRKSSGKEDRIKRKSQELKRRLSAAADDLFKPDEPTMATGKKSRHEKAKLKLPDDEVSGGETTSSSEEENDPEDGEWREEDDPERLWCVCRKPHDNRFMICCDRCEEWYHGDCVGISRKRGTQMETQNEEYICSQCKEKELVELLGGVEKLEASSTLLVTSSTSNSSTKDESVAESATTSTSGKVSTTETSPDGKPMVKLQGEIRKKKGSSSEKRKKFGTFRPRTPRQHCIGSGCENWAEESKIYCSLSCIIKHASESLDIINKEKCKTMGSKQEPGKVASDIVVMERHTGRLVTGAHAPVADNLIPWLTKHPTFEVLRPGQRTGHVSNTSFYGKQKSKLLSSGEEKPHKRTNATKDEETVEPVKKPAGPDPSTIRSTVKKSLVDALKERVKETSDNKVTEEEIKSIAVAIEHELFKYHGDTNNKYKTRFRSLIFNVKDPKNKGLFRKILRKKLKPAKLVRMTPDELASKELHQWREKEMQSELEKIKADEERKATMKSTLRKITHKGEIEVEEETYKDMDTRLEETVKDYDMSSSKNLSSSNKTSATRGSGDILTSIMGGEDTTGKHDSHLFDSNCKICIGKQAAPSGADLERKVSKKLKVSHKVSKVSISAPRTFRESSKEEIDKTVSNELKDLEKEIKVFEAEDKIIAEKLEKRRQSHKESKKLKKLDISPKREPSPKQEPSSTVRSPLSPPMPDLPSPTPVLKKKHGPSAWKGFVDVPEVCKFFTTAHGVHGNSDCLKTELPDCLQIVGRIHPTQVWEYIGQLRHTLTREVILVKFSAVNDEEKIGYKTYFKYLSEKKRFGVVGNGASTIKDMYIVPLPSHELLPTALQPYRHKVLADDNRPNMLVGVVVRTKSKRSSSMDSPYGSKRLKSDEDEPYEPPGIDDIIPAEPETPSPLTTPQPPEPIVNANVEEYDPTQPLVSLSASGSQASQEEMDLDDGDETYDPIVSAYSLADPETLNAEDAPGAAPYSPGQHDVEETEELYDPTTAPLVKMSPEDPDQEYNPHEPYDPMAPLAKMSPAAPDEPYDPMAPLVKMSPAAPDEPYDPMAPLAKMPPTAPDEPYKPTPPKTRLPPQPLKEPYNPAAKVTKTSQPPAEEQYDPTTPAPVKRSSDPEVCLLKDSELTEQQRVLKKLTEQVELQRKQLEEHKAQLAQKAVTIPTPPPVTTGPPTPPQQAALPQSITDLMSGRALSEQQTDQPFNMMDYLNRTAASRRSGGTGSPATKVPPLPTSTPTVPSEPSHSSNISTSHDERDRPKISFSLPGARSMSQSTRLAEEETSKPHRPYLPPASHPLPHSKQPLLAPPPPPSSMPMSVQRSAPSNPHNSMPVDPRVSSTSERLPPSPNRDEDYRRRGFRREYDERERWREDVDDRVRWRGPAYRDGAYQNQRDVDYRNRNRRGHGPDERYRNDY